MILNMKEFRTKSVYCSQIKTSATQWPDARTRMAATSASVLAISEEMATLALRPGFD
jgi:hypothetical protein